MANENSIKALREARKLTLEQLAEQVGLSVSYVSRLEKGGRNLSVKHIDAFARAFGVPRERILTEGDDNATFTNELRPTDLGELITIKISGKVKAGEFIAIEDLGDWDEPEIIHDTRDPRFPHARHLGFEVEGDSMNALKPRPIMNGDRLSALAYEDIADRYPLRDGMIVVVERTRHGGHEREWSVKQLEIYEDRVEFHPRSTNPRHKPIIVKREHHADDGMTVEIIAIVRRLVAEFNL